LIVQHRVALVANWRARWSRRRPDDDEQRLRRAVAVMDEAVRLSRAGHLEEARETGERGLAMVRELAGHDGGSAHAVLVQAAANQANLLSDLGRHRAALELAEEAVDRGRGLYTIDRSRVELLARALVSAANRLIDSGRPGEALAHSREAMDLADVLSGVTLARVLSTLALSLSATGEHVEALDLTERVLTMWGDLAVGEPPDSQANVQYGRTLSNRANRLYLIGRWEDAARAGADAVTWFRGAAGEAHGGGRAMLAQALGNHTILLAKVGRFDEALEAAAEAVAISRELVVRHAAYRDRLAAALRVYGARSAGFGRRVEGRAAIAESVRLLRELAGDDRAAYLPSLAEAVSDLGAFSDGGDGLALAEEAVALRRELVAANRRVELPGLALSLSILAEMQAEAGRLEEGLATGDEALRFIREAVEVNPTAMMPRYAFLLSEQTARLDRAGRVADAMTLGKQAVDAAREALDTHRAANLSGLAGALRAQARRLHHAPGRPSKNRARRIRAMISEAEELDAEGAARS
jgi:tetratricopeptide (TPR) repeat protein